MKPEQDLLTDHLRPEREYIVVDGERIYIERSDESTGEGAIAWALACLVAAALFVWALFGTVRF